MALRYLSRGISALAQGVALSALLYGCGGASESPYDGGSNKEPPDGSSGNENPPVTKECRDEAPYLDIQFSMKDGSYSFQEHFEGLSAEERGSARGWVRCRSGLEGGENDFGVDGLYPETANDRWFGVSIMTGEDPYVGPGAYDIDVSRADLGIPKVEAELRFRGREGVTSFDALLVSEYVGRRCVSGSVELYLIVNETDQPISKDVPGTLQFQGMCGEFIENLLESD